MSEAARVEVVEQVTDELVDAFARLIPQLSKSSPPPDAAALEALVSSSACTLFVARAGGGDIVGSLTLATFPIPTGTRAWIEDVVVDDAARGAGVGAALTRAALDRARDVGATRVDLTSRPSREAANRLYQRLGFEPRETNVYRFVLSDG
jgi:ribosomal protein S18 acetylase RimI-like enzyme